MASLLQGLERSLPYLTGLLAVASLCSVFAESFYFFDLFSHFKIQYVIGSFILLPLLLYFGLYYYAPLVLLVAFLNLYDITRAYDPSPAQTNAPTVITMAQYNRYKFNNSYDALRQWLVEKHAQIDVIFIQESMPDTIKALEQFKDLYPHQFPAKPSQRHNDISMLSKYPLTISFIPLEGHDYNLNATKVTLEKDGLDAPIYLYSLHTTTPLSYNQQRERNAQLTGLATAIAADNHKYVLASGDWNITPYSAYFQKFKHVSGLTQPAQGYFPDVTWPSIFLLPFLKIPIDHILHSPALQRINQYVGPAMGSDHHVVVASFAISDKK